VTSLKSRVTDGARTRDIRNHNPPSKLKYRVLRFVARALTGTETHRYSPVGAPGADSDVFDALRRVTT
jgi:hypothetical protein